MKRFKSIVSVLSFVSVAAFLCAVSAVSAHEAYVIPYDEFWNGLKGPVSAHAFAALESSSNIKVMAIIAVSVWILLGLNFLFRRSETGQKVHAFLERYAHLGPHFVRITIAVAFVLSGLSGSFLGPELHVGLFPYAAIVQASLCAIGVMIALGLFTELAAAAGILIFAAGFFTFGPYVLTYLNYLGELLVLLLFGMRVFSLDRFIFGPLRRFRTFEKYESLIVRVLYGLALIYAAITVKLLHPDLTTSVVDTWHLTRFHWLFPSDSLLVTLGAGIVETVIGLFIVFGFEMRLTILISLFYITLSLLYFRELVWPHLLLYGISFNLLVQPEVFTLDHLFFKRHRAARPWWKRPFSAHGRKGKSDAADRLV